MTALRAVLALITALDAERALLGACLTGGELVAVIQALARVRAT